MPYYLAPFIPVTPAVGRPFAAFSSPVGFDSQPNRNWIVLGNQALLWLETPIVDARLIQVAVDRAEPLALTSRTQLATLLGDRTYSAGTLFYQAVSDFLVTPPIGKGWGLLTQTREGRLEIWLGPGGLGNNLFWGQAGLALGPASQDIQDTFNRANGNIDGSTSSDGQFTWSQVQGTIARCQIVSNQRKDDSVGTSVFNVVLASLAMDTTNHYVQSDMVSRSGSGIAEIDMRIRFGTNAAGDEGYGFSNDPSAASVRRQLYDFQVGTTIVSDNVVTESGTMYLDFNGSTYTVKVAGTTIFTGTNTAYNTYKKVCHSGFAGGTSGNNVIQDNFRAADLEESPENLARRNMAYARPDWAM